MLTVTVTPCSFGWTHRLRLHGFRVHVLCSVCLKRFLDRDDFAVRMRVVGGTAPAPQAHVSTPIGNSRFIAARYSGRYPVRWISHGQKTCSESETSSMV